MKAVSATHTLLGLVAAFVLQFQVSTGGELRSIEAQGQEQPIYRYKSSSVYVVDEGKHRYLRFGNPKGTDQSILDLENPDRLAMPYLRPAALAAEFAGQVRNVLIIGFGGGGFSRYLRRRFPEAVIDAVEIDAEVIKVARLFFGISQDPYLRIYLADGATYLEELLTLPEGRYDLIFLDAYDGDHIPTPLTTDRFLTNVRAQLRDHGLVIANVGKDDLALYRPRFENIYEACAQLRVWQDENRILVGSKMQLPSRQDVILQANAMDTQGSSEFLYTTIARTWKSCRIPAHP